MYEIKLKFLPVVMVAASVAVAAEVDPAAGGKPAAPAPATEKASADPKIRSTVNRIDVGRQEIDERGGSLVREGNALFAAGQYMEACKKYRDAKSVYGKFAAYGSFPEKIKYCDKCISDCYFQMAQAAMRKADDLAQTREYDEAIKVCKEALKYCEPEQREELQRQIAVYEKRRDTAIERETVNAEQIVPNRKEQEYQIQVLMEKGRKLAMNREYGRAARMFQEVLLINPFNNDALQCLRAVNAKIGAIGFSRYKNEHRRMMGELEWKSATPYQPFSENAAQNLLDSGTAKVKTEEKGNELRQRLNEIRIPHLYCDKNTPVSRVIDKIRSESVKADPKKRGVNIVFVRSLPKKSAGDQGGSVGEDNGDMPRRQNASEDQIVEEEKISTLDVKDESVLKILDLLCEKTRSPKLCYQVDEHAVLIFPENQDLGGMMTEVININLEEGITDKRLREEMEANGIVFREGSGADVKYNAKRGRVVIKNDSQNLEKMKAFLENRRANEEAMVQLQIKLVEMSQNDIDELAFNWQYAVNANQSYYTGGNNTATPRSSSRTLTNATIMQSSSNELLRYYTPENTTTTMQQNANSSFMWANSDGTKITANMFALDWADSKDVLASPRITTLPGHTAKIEMVTIRYFPEDWDTIDVDTEFVRYGVSITRATAQPNLEKEKKLGPIFDIKPDIITRNGEKLIKLHLHFPITTFSDEWVIYDNTVNGGDDDGDYIQMPVFNTRTITCDVILGDGETIVLGGVSKDDTTTVNDKIPILGDIPFIGRFFQSKYSNASKNNLLIFLTGRLVKPDGSAYNPKTRIKRGLPDFGRIE